MNERVGATWADLGIELVRFAREEPMTFLAVLAAIALLTVLALYIVYLMIPKASAHLAAAVAHARQSAAQETRDLFTRNDDDA